MFKPAVFALYRIFNENMFKALFDIQLLATYLNKRIIWKLEISKIFKFAKAYPYRQTIFQAFVFLSFDLPACVRQNCKVGIQKKKLCHQLEVSWCINVAIT